jgi:hypothetical protein
MKLGAVLAVGSVSLLLSSCGTKEYSFAQLSVDQTGATATNTGGDTGGSNPGTSGSTGGSSGSTTGAGGSTGTGGSSGTGTGGSSGTATGGSSSTTGGSGTRPPTTPTTADCGPGSIKIEAKYKCHTGGGGTSQKIHCVFRSEDDDHGECEHNELEREDDDQDLDFHAVAWFVPGTAADASQAGCAAEEAGSLLARLNNLPLQDSKGCGKFHFRGSVQICVPAPLPKSKKARRAILIRAFLHEMAAAKGAVTVKNGSAKMGGKTVSLDIPGPVVNPSYCIKHPGCDRDRHEDPDNWIQKLGLKDDD